MAEAKEPSSLVKKLTLKMPHIFTLLFFFIVLAAIMTYVLPAGVYERVPGPDGREIIDPTSYHVVERTPVSLLKIFTAIPQGFVEAGWIIVMTFCVCGGFTVIRKTGIIEIAIGNLARGLKGKGLIIIPILMVVFGLIDSFIGMCEMTMVYVPIIMGLVLMLGFDSITAAAIALVGSAAGFTAALTNPFTIGIAQKIAGLPLYSGISFRIVTLTVTLAIGIAYVVRYAKKVRKNPQSSSVYEIDQVKRTEYVTSEEKKATPRQTAAGVSALILFAILLIGVLQFKWDLPEISGMFIAIGIVAGVIGGLNATRISEAFIEGSLDVLVGAFVIGIARGIVVVLNQGQITDTIINGLASVVQGLPPSLTALGMLFVQIIFSVIVPSGSGMALIVMPIMAPLADIVGITRQTAVLAFQYGDGLTNILTPTSGYFMATLAIAKVPYEKWFKFMWPLFLIWVAVGGIFLLIAQAINWGPF